jgi:4-hydroxy-tetrahydrodipicolinate synthase
MATQTPFAPRGIWPPLLINWDRQWKLDLPALDANLERLIALRPHGLYTLDTASEFYTMEFDEWDFVARRFVATCRRLAPDLPIGLGCTWTNQVGALRRIAAARDLGVQCIHLSTPYWLPLNEDGLLRFLEAVQAQAGRLGVVLYAPPWGKLTMTASLYARAVQAAPCVIGTKTVGDDEALLASPTRQARHSHFVHESKLMGGFAAGASGNYSSLAGISMPFMLGWWRLIEQGSPNAAAIHEHVLRFYREGVEPLRQRGILAGAIDKSMAQIGGMIGSRELRPPYPSCPDDLYETMREAAARLLDACAPLLPRD